MTQSTTLRRQLRRLAPALAAVLVLAACGSDDGAEVSTEPATASPTEATEPMSAGSEGTSEGTEHMSESPSMTPSATMTDEMTPSESAASQAAPEPAATPALDISATMADGSTLTLADYAGEPIFVETFATWCSNCRSQLGDTQQAAAQAGDDAVFLALSVETDLDPARLDDYVAENGFSDVTFAVLTDQSLATLADQFGNGVLVPPSTPKFTVATDGSISELTTGFESVEQILGQLDTTA